MSLFDFIKPKWRHRDPAVRLAAVATLVDQSILARVAAEDASDEVRVAATRLLTAPEVLGWLVGTADSARVREAAVALVHDLPTLRRAAACDECAWVRGRARLRAKFSPSLRARLATELAGLAVAVATPATPDFTGTCDEVCTALLTDRRLCLNGQLAVENAPAPRAVEFLAAARSAAGDPIAESATADSYLVRVTRQGDDRFSVQVIAHRYEMASNAAALGWQHGGGADGRTGSRVRVETSPSPRPPV